MAKKKKPRLTAEFLRRDAEARAEADRMIEILRREEELKRQQKQSAG